MCSTTSGGAFGARTCSREEGSDCEEGLSMQSDPVDVSRRRLLVWLWPSPASPTQGAESRGCFAGGCTCSWCEEPCARPIRSSDQRTCTRSARRAHLSAASLLAPELRPWCCLRRWELRAPRKGGRMVRNWPAHPSAVRRDIMGGMPPPGV
jgi:hypothetical protein